MTTRLKPVVDISDFIHSFNHSLQNPCNPLREMRSLPYASVCVALSACQITRDKQRDAVSELIYAGVLSQVSSLALPPGTGDWYFLNGKY